MALDPRLRTRRRWAKLSFFTLISTIPACMIIAFFCEKAEVDKLASLAFIISPAIAGLVWVVHEYFEHCLQYDSSKEENK